MKIENNKIIKMHEDFIKTINTTNDALHEILKTHLESEITYLACLTNQISFDKLGK